MGWIREEVPEGCLLQYSFIHSTRWILPVQYNGFVVEHTMAHPCASTGSLNTTGTVVQRSIPLLRMPGLFLLLPRGGRQRMSRNQFGQRPITTSGVINADVLECRDSDKQHCSLLHCSGRRRWRMSFFFFSKSHFGLSFSIFFIFRHILLEASYFASTRQDAVVVLMQQMPHLIAVKAKLCAAQIWHFYHICT